MNRSDVHRQQPLISNEFELVVVPKSVPTSHSVVFLRTEQQTNRSSSVVMWTPHKDDSMSPLHVLHGFKAVRYLLKTNNSHNKNIAVIEMETLMDN